MARMVQCIKLGKEAEGLDFPPYPGELGKRIWQSVSKEAWAGWIKHQTMLVNLQIFSKVEINLGSNYITLSKKIQKVELHMQSAWQKNFPKVIKLPLF